MDEAQFWQIIEEAHAAASGDCEEQAEILQAKLETLPVEEIIAFDGWMDTLRSRAYGYDVWGAAYLLQGGCSDDGFEYFRGWLIAQGRQVYDNTLADPDSLADVLTDEQWEEGDLECWDIIVAAYGAYAAVTGSAEMPDSNLSPEPPREDKGAPWKDSSDLYERYPRINARMDALL
jgi:hypothetical protein